MSNPSAGTASAGTAAHPSPVARVLIDSPLPHLDRPFDYAVPAKLAETAQPGVRVKVRFAGKDVDAYVLERRADSDHTGPLTPLRRVVSAEPVLTPQLLDLIAAVADHYAGNRSDVLRLAVPPRHASVERSIATASGDAGKAVAGQTVPDRSESAPGTAENPWAGYPAGPALVERLRRGDSPRAVWSALPGARHWAGAIAEACRATLDSGRGAIVVLPDRRDVDLLDAELTARFGPGRHVRLEADLGPAARYRGYLACLRGEVQVAIGTRSAAYAPIADLGLLVIWDDGDDSYDEPRAPYPHSREVLRIRAGRSDAAMLIGGWGVSAESAQLLADGWARPVTAPRASVRGAWPRIVPEEQLPAARHGIGSAAARTGVGLSAGVWRVVQDGLAAGPVLVQVPRSGYLAAVACTRCRGPVRCPRCDGPAALAENGTVSCRFCHHRLDPWTCPHCGGTTLRATQIGVMRVAEELGRAFPKTPVVVSRPDRELPVVPAGPAIVLATTGIEPIPRTAYAAAVLLAGDFLLARADLHAGEAALRRWLAAAALVAPSSAGGVVALAAGASAPAVQAAVRVDPGWFAERELAERTELRLPPAAVCASLTGESSAVAAWLRQADLESLPALSGVERLGPFPVSDRSGAPPGESSEQAASGQQLAAGFELPTVRVVLRVARERREEFTRAVRAASVTRSARREIGAVRVQIDPQQIG